MFCWRHLLWLGITDSSRADTPPGEQIYVWQADNSLSRLAEKFYDDPLAWPAIVVATNARVELDGRFARIMSSGRHSGRSMAVDPGA